MYSHRHANTDLKSDISRAIARFINSCPIVSSFFNTMSLQDITNNTSSQIPLLYLWNVMAIICEMWWLFRKVSREVSYYILHTFEFRLTFLLVWLEWIRIKPNLPYSLSHSWYGKRERVKRFPKVINNHLIDSCVKFGKNNEKTCNTRSLVNSEYL